MSCCDIRALPVVLFLIFSGWESPARAQPFHFGNDRPRESNAVLIGYTAIDFTYAGSEEPPTLLEFVGPALSVLYSRSNFVASVSWGTKAAADTSQLDLSSLDLSLLSWGEVFFSSAAKRADHRVFVPITIYTNYRRVSPRHIDVLDDFSITTIGLGLGLGYYGRFSERALLEVRVTPAVGLALQSFSDSAGSARLLDADVQLHLGPVAHRLGLSLGYNYRIKRWNVGGSSVFVTRSSDLFDYMEHRHTAALGVNW